MIPARAARRDRGVTIIEAAVVMMAIAVVSLFAVPYLQSGRILANEAEAVRLLREIAASERRFLERSAGATYGLLPELLGENQRRGVVAEPRVLPFQGLRRVESFVQWKGYTFGVYLPTEHGGTWSGRAVDSRRAGSAFVAYAWPINVGYSGRMHFVVDESGVVRRWKDERGREVRGESSPPAPNFAPHASNAFGPPPTEMRQAVWEVVEAP